MRLNAKLRMAKGDFKDEPAQLLHKRPILERRLDHADDLASRRGGVGINTAVRLRKILRDIEAEARTQFDAGQIDEQQYQSQLDRIASIRQKLMRSEENRRTRLKAKKEDRQRLRQGSTPPFPLPASTEVWWESDVKNGRVDWFLSIPANIKFHITRRKSDGPREIPATTAI